LAHGAPALAPTAPLATTLAFARAAGSYWFAVFPLVRRELAAWRAHAERIPDARLRAHALSALAERGNMEGAAAFATFVSRRHRPAVVGATVAFQAAYNHLDLLSELLAPGQAGRARLMHLALPAALYPQAAHRPSPSAWAEAAGTDGGYLNALLARCRDCFAGLPSAPAARDSAIQAAERVVAFQSWQAGGAEPDAATLDYADPAPADLRSFELAGAAGSSLGVHALIASAADSALTPATARALDAAYFPAIGALHTLLDHLVDRHEDHAHGQPNLTDRYASPAQLQRRLTDLTRAALTAARALPDPTRHELIVCAMSCFYLSAPAARAHPAQPAARAVAAELGWPAPLARAVFAARSRLGPGAIRSTTASTRLPDLGLASGQPRGE
jgi:tetraprenyl-beta-curcumene synthase